MRLRDDFVAVSVPATSANLGPGFDCMGMALDLWDDVSVHATAGASEVVVEGEGAGSIPTDESHLIVSTIRAALERVGAPQVGIRMRCMNRIPHARGLGSSASAIVAGLALARALVGDPEVLTEAEMLELGTEIEGHPDNIAPAIFGGITASWMGERGTGTLVSPAPQDISPVVFIPDYELPTSSARGALPGQIPYADAVFNVSRSAILSMLLARPDSIRAVGNGAESNMHDALMAATEDRLHQNYRRTHMESSVALVEWLRAAGKPAVISGAGPTVLSFESIPAQVRRDAQAAGWKVLPVAVSADGVRYTRGRIAKELPGH